MPVSWSEEHKREYVSKLDCPHGCEKPLKATLIIRQLPKGEYDVDLQIEHEQ